GIEIGRLMQKSGGGFRERLFEAIFWNNDDTKNYAGAFRALVPCENALSTSDATSLRLGKMRGLNDNLQILHRLIQSGLPQVNLAVMLGFPEDTPESLKATRRNLEAIMTMRDHSVATSTRQIGTHI